MTLGLQLVGALGQFWMMRSQWSEGIRWLQRALEAGQEAPAVLRAQALLEAGKLLHYQWRFEQSEPLLRQSLALYEAADDKRGIAGARLWLGRHAFRQKDYPQAAGLTTQSLALYQELDNPHGVSLALRNLGDCARLSKDYTQASELYQRGLALSRKIDNTHGVVVLLNSLGELERLQGNLQQAKALYEEELALLEELGDKLALAIAYHNLGQALLGLGDLDAAGVCFKHGLAYYPGLEHVRGTALCVAGLGGIAGAAGQGEQAVLLLARAEATLTSGQFPLPMGPADQAAFDGYRAAAQAQLAPPAFAAAWEAGMQMALEEAVAWALNNLSLLPR